MKTLTEIVVALIQLMEGEEQKEFLATLAQGKQPTKPRRAMTNAERWWLEKLSPKAEWITTIAVDELLDEFIKATGWTRSRHGARTSMGRVLGKLCPEIRRDGDDYLIPDLDQARGAFSDVFPWRRSIASAPGVPVEESGPTLLVDGKRLKVLRTTMID